MSPDAPHPRRCDDDEGIPLHFTANVDALFCSLAVLDPRVGHTMDVMSPFISVLRHSH